jgi:hypothetical protein
MDMIRFRWTTVNNEISQKEKVETIINGLDRGTKDVYRMSRLLSHSIVAITGGYLIFKKLKVRIDEKD